LSAADPVQLVRRAAGLFQLEERGLIEVRGADRVRWLAGQLSNDVAGLEAGGARSGCYALLLTPQGRIVADLHVLARPDAFWLETEHAALGAALERLDRYLIADEVELVEPRRAVVRLGIEGPRTPAVLASLLGRSVQLPAESGTEVAIAGASVLVAAFGWSGEAALQLFVPSQAAAEVEGAVRQAGASEGLIDAGPEALEVLRIEAGIPRFGRELDPEVLPAEARLLERGVCFTKGCYIGQEVVARMHSRGQVKHLLVGLAVEGATPPAAGAALEVDSRRVGEVTSSAHSPSAGCVALGYVRRPHDAPGTLVRVEERAARVVSLPFVEPASGAEKARTP
jgi:aminomethyltransferase